MLEQRAFPKRFRIVGPGLSGLLVAALLLMSPAVKAQDVQALQNQVDRLQREMTDLQRAFYQGGGTAASGTTATNLPAGSAARLEVRIGELEQSLRQLRGQIEEMNYRIGQNQDRLETLSADVDYRLTVLEGGTPGEAAGSAVAQSPSSALKSAEAEPAATASSPSATAPQVGTLGQVSENDVARIQQNRPLESETSGGQRTAAAAGPTQVTLPEGSPEAQYDFALGLLRQTRFDEAEAALGAFIDAHPKHLLTANAKYWLGETYYVRGDYQNAAVTFAEGFQEYPNSAKAPDNLLKLGMALGQLGDKDNACATFAQLQQRFPTAPANIQQKAQLERQRFGCS